MTSQRWRGLCVCAVVAMLAGGACAKPPEKDLALAKANLEKAVAAGGDGFAAEPMARARRAQAALDAEMKAQSSAWFKSYDLADDLAIEVQAFAERAANEAAGGRERTLALARSASETTGLGPNLFQNGSFTDGTKEWSLHPQSDSTVTVEPMGPNGRAWHVTYRAGNWSVIYQEQMLKPDTVYVYEGWVKSTAPIVALYWQSEIGRYFEIDKSYPTWTHLRYVFITPHWTGQPYRTGFNPVLMKGPGEAWLRDLRIAEVSAPPVK